MRQPLPYPTQQYLCISFLHPNICEQPFASIFQACPKDIHVIINNQEAVMIVLTYVDCDRRVLLVVTLHSQLLLSTQRTSKDGGCNTCVTTAEHRQCGFVNIVIYKHNRCFGLLNKTNYLGVGIKYLAVKEDSFNRWQRCAHEEVDLAFQLLYLNVLLGSVLFKNCNTCVNHISTQQVFL